MTKIQRCHQHEGFEPTGVTIDRVTITVDGDHYIDEDTEAHAMLVRE